MAMKLSKYDLIAVSILFLLVGIFFLPLFYPTSQVYVTPGYTKSDLLHFNFPVKELLSQSLKNNSLPIWTDLIGTGFPVLAESQVQAFSLINIILFKVFPTVIAFNAGYVVSFLLFSLGMYLVARDQGYSRFTSFLCSFLFTFSGFNIVRIQHYNTLSGICYMPFIFLFTKRFIKNRNTSPWLVLPFLISQFMLSAHMQTIFLTSVFFLIVFSVWRFMYKPPQLSRETKIRMIIIILISLGLSFIQLLPTFEYFTQSERGNLIKLFTTTKTGLSGYNFIQFIQPYFYGDIRNGTYSLINNDPNFWESFNYIGILPFILATLSLFYVKKNRRIALFWIVMLILIILAFEGNSPLYLFYALPPLSFFHIYVRFLPYIFFLLILLTGFVYQKIVDRLVAKPLFKYLVALTIIAISFIDLWRFASSYNPSDNVSEILQTPQTARYLSEHKPGRVYSLGSETLWRPIFTSYGWKDINRYKYAINMLNPNVNMIYNVPNTDVYAGFFLQKQLFVNSLIRSDFDMDNQTTTASLSATGITMLRLTGTDYVITPFVLTNPELNRVFDVKSPYKDLGDIHIYNLPTAMHRYYIAYRIASVSGMRETAVNLNDPSWGQKYDAIINDGDRRLISNKPPNTNIEVKAYTDTNKIFYYNSDNDGYFLLLTYLYPGWEAKVDGKKTSIVNGNISSIAVFAPKGAHRIEFTFVPKSLYLGAVVSGISVVLYGALIIVQVRRKHS